MNNNAKDIFIKYSGNQFQMKRDGKLEEYESFNISNENEFLWIKEYINKFSIKLDSDIKFDIDEFYKLFDFLFIYDQFFYDSPCVNIDVA